MALKIHDVEQGSAEWFAARCGMLTASEMHLIVTPTLKAASNEKERGHLYELLGQRITHFVEPTYCSFDMLRGKADELDAVSLYHTFYKLVTMCGFMTNDKWGFSIGYSPDGLVGDDGLVEVKSRNQKHQVKTWCEYSAKDKIDPDFMIQVQTGLLVSERQWCHLISYCGGLPMSVVKVYPDEAIQNAIVEAAAAFEKRLEAAHEVYKTAIVGSVQTERRIEEEIHV